MNKIDDVFKLKNIIKNSKSNDEAIIECFEYLNELSSDKIGELLEEVSTTDDLDEFKKKIEITAILIMYVSKKLFANRNASENEYYEWLYILANSILLSDIL